MKNISIKVPRGGTAVKLVLRAGASSGQAVIVVSDDVEIVPPEQTQLAPSRPKALLDASNAKAHGPKIMPDDLDAIFNRLLKLKVSKRSAAINSITSMFQFDAPISDETANEILEKIHKRGDLTIDASDKIRFHTASR